MPQIGPARKRTRSRLSCIRAACLLFHCSNQVGPPLRVTFEPVSLLPHVTPAKLRQILLFCQSICCGSKPCALLSTKVASWPIVTLRKVQQVQLAIGALPNRRAPQKSSEVWWL